MLSQTCIHTKSRQKQSKMNHQVKPRRRYCKRNRQSLTDKEIDVRNPEFSTAIVARAEQELENTQRAAIASVRKVAQQLDLPTDDSALQTYTEGTNGDLQHITQYMMKSSRDTGSYEHGLSIKPRPQSKSVAIVNRAWEEKFLHEPKPFERPCVNSFNNSCFASKLVSDKRLTLCEFYFPGETQKTDTTDLRPCLLCLRAEAFRSFVQVRCSQCEINENLIFQRIGNIVNQRGEYCVESCFVSSTSRYEGVVHPIVLPCVKDYRVVKIDGLLHVQQLHPKPEDISKGSSFFF